MSCPTGIRPNEELKTTFARCKDGKTRLLKIVIAEEELRLAGSERVSKDVESDVGKALPRLVSEKEPCYFLVLLDSGTRTGCDWMMVVFSPDAAPIRAKMLLAATRSTLKTEFGAAYVKDEWHIAAAHEASLDGYQRHLKAKATPGPMTELEAELQAVKVEEAEAKKAAMARSALPSQTLRGVAFPIDGSAQAALKELRDGDLNYVQLSVDTLNEAIKLEASANVAPNDLKAAMPRNKPRYHFYRFKHELDGRRSESVVFIYSIPGGGCTIKERMLFSSCKGPFLDTVERFLGLEIHRKVEIDAGETVTEEWLMSECCPGLAANGDASPAKAAFAKPKGPGGRGLPRITRPVQ